MSEVNNEDTKFSFSLKTIITCLLGVISFFSMAGYVVGSYKSETEQKLIILELNQKYQHEIAKIKDEQMQIRLQMANDNAVQFERVYSLLKQTKNNEN